MESWVKESGILGGGGKEPTIVSPKQYKTRFREAMDRYFLLVPDPWTHLTLNTESENNPSAVHNATQIDENE